VTKEGIQKSLLDCNSCLISFCYKGSNICVPVGKFSVMESVTSVLQAAVDWMSLAFEAPFARADVFGVHIGGMRLYLCRPILVLYI